MPTFRIVFVGEKAPLQICAFQVRGNQPEDKGDSYTFRNSPNEIIAIIPKAQVLYIKIVNADPQ